MYFNIVMLRDPYEAPLGGQMHRLVEAARRHGAPAGTWRVGCDLRGVTGTRREGRDGGVT